MKTQSWSRSILVPSTTWSYLTLRSTLQYAQDRITTMVIADLIKITFRGCGQMGRWSQLDTNRFPEVGKQADMVLQNSCRGSVTLHLSHGSLCVPEKRYFQPPPRVEWYFTPLLHYAGSKHAKIECFVNPFLQITLEKLLKVRVITQMPQELNFSMQTTSVPSQRGGVAESLTYTSVDSL